MYEFSDDIPIEEPEEDLLGVNTLAVSISQCILDMCNPVGSVIAVNGSWGSGKTSITNLVLNHIDKSTSNRKPIVIKFQSWMYQSEEKVMAGLLRELYIGLRPTFSKSTKARIALHRIVPNFIDSARTVRSVIGAVSGSFMNHLLDIIVLPISNLISDGISSTESIESLQNIVCREMKRLGYKFLFVIDDIDRLSPDEMLAIFRTIKSIGRLPNVLYLISYDRTKSEDLIRLHYPSEGPEYLEKIIQSVFDVPVPSEDTLFKILNAKVSEAVDDNEGTSFISFKDMMREVIFPEIETIRDINRFANMLSVTYPALRDEVNLEDFVAIESLRMFRPSIYGRLPSNKRILLETIRQVPEEERHAFGEDFAETLLKGEPMADHPRLQRALCCVFPNLSWIWDDSGSFRYGNDEKNRRVCTASNFDTYFRFTTSQYTVSNAEISEIIQNASNEDFIRSALLEASKIWVTENRTKASVILDELIYRSKLIDIKDTQILLNTLFSLSDKFRYEPNIALSYQVVDNNRRIIWLTENILRDRFSKVNHSKMILQLCKNADLGALIEMGGMACCDFNLPVTNPFLSKSIFNVDKKDATEIVSLALEAVRSAAASYSLLEYRRLYHILIQWKAMINSRSDIENGDDLKNEVQIWHDSLLMDDKNVIRLAHLLLAKDYNWYFSVETNDNGIVRHISNVINLENLLNRLSEMMSSPDFDYDSYDMKIVMRAYATLEKHYNPG